MECFLNGTGNGRLKALIEGQEDCASSQIIRWTATKQSEGGEKEKENFARDYVLYMRGRSNDETGDKNVNGYNCCGCDCGEDVWRLARVKCTKGWQAGGRGGDRGRGYEKGRHTGWRTWYSAHRTIPQGGSEDFSFYSNRFVFLSAMDPTSRICSRQPCSFPAALIHLFSEFRHVRAASPPPCSDRIELKCNLSTFRLDQKSTAKWSFYVSLFLEITK